MVKIGRKMLGVINFLDFNFGIIRGDYCIDVGRLVMFLIMLIFFIMELI